MIADMGKTGNSLLIVAIVIVVAVAAFGLSRLSALSGVDHGFAIHPAPIAQTRRG